MNRSTGVPFKAVSIQFYTTVYCKRFIYSSSFYVVKPILGIRWEYIIEGNSSQTQDTHTHTQKCDLHLEVRCKLYAASAYGFFRHGMAHIITIYSMRQQL